MKADIRAVGNRLNRRLRPASLAAALCVLAGGSLGSARAEVSLEARAGVGRSDNINLAAEESDALEETIHTLSTDFLVTGSTSRTTTDFGGNFQYFRYVDQTFDDELVGGASLYFSGEIAPERVQWIVTENFGQQSIDPLQPMHPGNRRNANVFRTGPNFRFPLGGRTQLDLQARRSLFSLEDADIDNSRTDAQLALTRAHGTVWSSSIGVASENVEYDHFEDFDFDTSSVFLSASAVGNRSSVTLRLGSDRIDNDTDDADGTRYRLRFRREFMQGGAIGIIVGRGFSDAGNVFRSVQDSFLGASATQDFFATPDPFENTEGSATYTRTEPLMRWGLQALWREDEYRTQTQFNRDEVGLRFVLRRRFGVNWELGADGYSVRRDFGNLGLKDYTHIWSMEAVRGFGRTLGVGLRVDRAIRDQRLLERERAETRLSVFFIYRRERSGIVRNPIFDTF